MRRKSNIWKRGVAVVSSAAMVLGMLSATPKMQVQAASDSVQFEPLEIAGSSLNGNAIWGLTEDANNCALDDSAYFYAASSKRNGGIGGLPVNGKLTTTNGTPYCLASGEDTEKAYDGNDCIQLNAGTKSVTMNLQTIGAYEKIYVLATAGGPGKGNYADFNVTLTYTDGTTSSTNYRLYDWFDLSTVSNVEQYYNVARRNISGGSYDGVTDSSDGPILQSATISSEKSKLLKSITFNLNGRNGSSDSSGLYCGIFAVSGATPQGVTSAPVATKATDINKSSGPCFTANWNAVTGANSYVLDVATDRNFTNILSSYNNQNVGSETSYKVSGLEADTTYYYRVRAVNDKGQSLSSNRVATGVPDWAAAAGITDNDAEYDAENGILTVNNNVKLKDTITIPSGEKTIIQLENNCEVKAPDGKSAIKGNGKNVELKVTGDGKIIGGDGANGAEGAPAIDLSGVTGAGQVEIAGNANIIGGNGADASGENQNGGAGGAAIKGNSSTTVSVGSSSESGSAAIIGGNGGAGKGTGNGGAGGTGIENSPVKITTGNQLSGGNGGDAENGNGGNGGAGVSGQTKKPSVPEGTTSGGNGGKSDKGAEYGGAGGSSGATGGTDGTKGHEHVFAAKWSTDKNSHWHVCTVCGKKSDEAAHTESGWIIDKPATKLEEGKKHKECIICKYVMEEETISKITKTEDDYLTLAKQTVEDVVRGLSATNDMTQENLENSVKEAFRNAGIPESVTAAVEKFENTPATTDEVGKVTATITITNGDKTVSVPVNKVIPVQGKTDAEKAEEIKKELDAKISDILVNNNSKPEDIQQQVEDILKKSQISDATVTTEITGREEATTEKPGKITGTVKVTTGEKTVEIPFEQVIPQLSADDKTKVEAAKDLVEKKLEDVSVDEKTTDGDIIAQIKKQLELAGYTDMDITIEDTTKVEPTEEAKGSYEGTIVIKTGNESQTITFFREIQQTGTSNEGRADKAKQKIEEILANTTYDNQQTTGDVIDQIAKELQNSGYTDVAIVSDNLIKKDATSVAPGSITGNIVVKAGDQEITIPVDKVIPTLAQTDAEKVQAAESALNKNLPDVLVNNKTTAEDMVQQIQQILKDAGIENAEITGSENLKITEATKDSPGSITGTVTIKIGTEELSYEVKQTIPKLAADTSEKLKDAETLIENRINNLLVDNNVSEEKTLEEIKNMLSQAGMEDVTASISNWKKTDATYDVDGTVEGTITIKSGDKEKTLTISQSIPKLIKPDAQKAVEAKTKLEEALKQFTWGNETSLDEIKKELQKTADADGATVDTTGLTITPATSKSNGSVTGSIKVTVGTQTVEIPVEQVIPKLNKTPEEKVAEAKTEAKEFLPNLTVSNDSTKDSILKDLQDQLQKAGLADVTVTIESFEQKPATTDTVGHISGTVTVEKDGKKESFSFEKLISKLPKDDTQKTAKAKNIIVSQLDDSIIKNSTTPEELQQKLKEELQKSGMPDVELTVGDLQKTPATKEKDGTVTGTITVRCGDQEIQIPVSEKIPYEMTPEENAQMAQKVVEEKVKTITANNATTKDSIIEELQKELEKAGVRGAQLELKQFNKTNATTKKAGSVSGTVIAIVGEKVYEIPVKMEISKLDKSDSETVKDARKLVQEICNSKNADGFQAVNSTTKETLQEVLEDQLKKENLDVDVSVIKLETKPATSEKEGSITATVQIKSGNTKSEFKVILPIQKISTSTDGKFTVEGTEKKTDAPKTELDSTIDDIKDAIPNIKPDENVNIYLKVEQQPAEPEKKEQQKIQTVAEKEGVTVEQYVDISLFKRVTSGDTEDITKLSELNKKVKLSIVVPENLHTTDKNVTRTYMLIHYHDGEAEAELVEGEYDAATYTFTFETDKFSTYAIAYKDTTKNESGTSSGETEIPAKTNQEILALAKTSAQQTLNHQKVTNATTKEEIAQAVENALAAEKNTKNVSAEVLSFTKVASTTEKEGSISGIIKLTINGVTEEVPFSYTIAKLSQGDSADNSGKESFPYMIATASSAKVGNKQVGMSWKKVKDADGYEVYASTCDGKNNFKRVADTKKLSFTHKKLSNSKAYKYYVRAYKLVNGKKVYLKKTVTIHVALKEQKYTNAKAVTLNKKSYALKVGQKAQIKAKTVKENAKKKLLTYTAEFRYYTDNSEVAVVSKNGKITAKKAGICTIYVMANNGVYNTVKVTVK